MQLPLGLDDAAHQVEILDIEDQIIVMCERKRLLQQQKLAAREVARLAKLATSEEAAREVQREIQTGTSPTSTRVDCSGYIRHTPLRLLPWTQTLSRILRVLRLPTQTAATCPHLDWTYIPPTTRSRTEGITAASSAALPSSSSF